MEPTVLADMAAEMRLANRSEVTIKDRLETLDRLARALGHGILEASASELLAHQRTFQPLAPATVDIYTRHIQAFYKWAVLRGYLDDDPAVGLVRPSLRRGRPHPTSLDDLRMILACTVGALRMAYVLAAFAGLRRGEICRLHRTHIDFDPAAATALIHGKGGKERTVPLLAPVIAEIRGAGLESGWLVTKGGNPYPVEALSIDSHFHLHGLGVSTTLHSMRHTFGTVAYRTSRDIMLVRDLLGHTSVSTTQIYVESDTAMQQQRLSGVADIAADLMQPRRLFAVRGSGAGA